MESDGLLRVGGRLKNAKLPFGSKHQILLPKSHFVTGLIIVHAHLRCKHGGLKLTTSTLRDQFWVPDVRQEITRLTSK